MERVGRKWLLILSLVGIVTSLTWFYLGQTQEAQLIYQEDLQNHLKKQENQVATYLEDEAFLNYLLKRDEVRYLNEVEQQLQQLARLKKESFSLFLVQHQDFQLVHTGLHFTNPILDDLRTNRLEEGWHLIGEQAHLVQIYDLEEATQAIVWIPASDLPAEMSWLTEEQTNAQLVDLKGYPSLYWLGSIQRYKNLIPLGWLFFFTFWGWLIGNAYLSLFLAKAAYRKYFYTLFGMSAWLLVFVYYLSQLNNQPAFPREWDVWEPILDGVKIGPSPLLILVQASIVFWLFTQFYRFFADWKPAGFRGTIFKTLSAYLLSLSLLLGVAAWLRHIILNSKIFLNLDATLQLNAQGFLVALALVLLLLGVFLFVYRLFKWLATQQLPFLYRLGLMLLALLLLAPAVLWLQLGLSIGVWALMGFIFLMLYDLLVDGETFNFTWLMVWLIMMSAFAASLSYKYVLVKDVQTMQAYSQQLLEPTAFIPENLARLDALNRYAYLFLENGKIQSSQEFITDLAWRDLTDLPEGEIFQSKTAQYLSLAQRQGSNLIVLQKNLRNYFSPLALFALFFMLFILVILILYSLQGLVPVLPTFLHDIFSVKHSLKNRIQLAVIGIVLGSSILIGAVTVWYFKSTARFEQQQTALAAMKTLQQNWETTKPELADRLDLLENDSLSWLENQTAVFSIYHRSGQYLTGNDDPVNAPQWMSVVALEALKVQFQPYLFEKDKQQEETLYTTLKNKNGQIIAYLAIPSSRSAAQLEQQLNNFVGSIFSLYVFFMFIAGGIAIWVANSITEPISEIGASLSKLQLESNTPLVWKNEDEIGLLIQQYNLALKKLEESSKQLRRSEREGAWREMAKQVAHEIKNPLTPMKLSVQHLLRAYQINPETVGPLIQRVSTTLIEQIEGLTKIADEFSHFAKMPKAQLAPLVLNNLLVSITDLYTNQENDTVINLELPPESIEVLADRDQLIRVFNNLITNALQAIPKDRKGVITIAIKKIEEQVEISIADNGLGIPADLKDQVFYPNFTTKSSGTGIGLSMSRNIIEQFGGQIYFETMEQVGTTFYISLSVC